MPRARCILCLLTFATLFTTACEQEKKYIHRVPPGGTVAQGVHQTELQPGPMIPVRRTPNPFAGNAHAIGEGKKLYSQYNCAGCHANGGGAIGPPLMDEQWMYGSAAENIFATIVQGRPQGMPAFGGRIVEYQIWQIVAYVRSMSDLDTNTAAKPLTQQAQQEKSVDEAKQ